MQRRLFLRVVYICMILAQYDISYASIKWTKNIFNDVVAHYIDTNETVEQFEKDLVELQQVWKDDGYKALWFTLSTQHTQYLPVLFKHKLDLHHASSLEIVLIADIAENGKATLPEVALQKLSAVGLVIDANNNVLVVKELYQPELGYKLPGGAANPGEHIGECACREIKEETGIDSEFVGFIALRHHAIRAGSQSVGTLTFGCLMKPISHEIQIQESEIAQACWMPYDEFKVIARDTSAQFLDAYETGIVLKATNITQTNPLMLYTPFQTFDN